MNSKKAEKRPEAPDKRGRNARLEPDAAFDLWLERSLRALYDEVAKEPIPDDLLKLIEDDKAR